MDDVAYTLNTAWPKPPKPDFSTGSVLPTHTRNLLHCKHWFQSFAKALILKVKSDHRQQLLIHSAAETSDILHS